MRLITSLDYIRYIKNNPRCTISDLKEHVIGCPLDTILLEILKYNLGCYDILDRPIMHNIRNIVIIK